MHPAFFHCSRRAIVMAPAVIAAATARTCRGLQTAAHHADTRHVNGFTMALPEKTSRPRRLLPSDRMAHMDEIRDYLQCSPGDQRSITKAVAVASRIPQTSVSLKDLETYGVHAATNLPATLINASAFLARELPVRFAHRIIELQSLPYGLSDMEAVRKVVSWYRQSFADVVLAPVPNNLAAEAEWTQMMERIYVRHGATLVTMARAIHDLKRTYGDADTFPREVEDAVFPFLDRFYTSRIGIRTLVAQHIELRRQREGYVGIIDTCTSPAQIARAAAADARLMCERTFAEAPDVDVICQSDFRFPYVPAHLHHMLFELVKNSMRAVVETHSSKGRLPPVKVIISAGKHNEDVVIKVSDEGGGIPRSGMHRIWSYFFTTYPSNFSHWVEDVSSDFSTETPLAGLGYGLPLSRLYARYFGGDLQIISMEGFGTDAYIHLKNVGDAVEPVNDCENASSSDDEAFHDLVSTLRSQRH